MRFGCSSFSPPVLFGLESHVVNFDIGQRTEGRGKLHRLSGIVCVQVNFDYFSVADNYHAVSERGKLFFKLRFGLSVFPQNNEFRAVGVFGGR